MTKNQDPRIADAQVAPLPYKHYSTDVDVVVDVEGMSYDLTVSISGYAPKASKREKERGWEPEWGMDHTESETHLYLAHKIVEALTKPKRENQ